MSLQLKLLVAIGVVITAIGIFAAIHFLSRPNVELTQGDIPGTWTDGAGATLTIRPDGTFDATGLPNEVFDEYGRVGAPRSGEGTWELVSPVAFPEGPRNQVGLVFTHLDRVEGSYVTRLRAERRGGGLVLYFLIGDPDLNARLEMTRSE